jgi:hypothetical protein
MGFTVDAAVFAASQLVFAVGGVVFLRLGLFTSIEMNHRLIQVGFPTRQCSHMQACPKRVVEWNGWRKHMTATSPCFLASPGQPFVSPGQPFVSPGQPFVSPGQPFVSPGQPFVSPGQPFVSPGQPFVSPGQPFVSPGQPFVSPGQPFVSLGQPFVSPGQPFVSLGQLFPAFFQYFVSPLLAVCRPRPTLGGLLRAFGKAVEPVSCACSRAEHSRPTLNPLLSSSGAHHPPPHPPTHPLVTLHCAGLVRSDVCAVDLDARACHF